jgi:hypothetical protein
MSSDKDNDVDFNIEEIEQVVAPAVTIIDQPIDSTIDDSSNETPVIKDPPDDGGFEKRPTRRFCDTNSLGRC